MNFKKRRLNKALEEKTYRVKLVHGKKGWITVGLTFITLFSLTALNQKTVDASAVNNIATANSTTDNYVQLWNNVTKDSIHKANRGLQNGTTWKTAKAVKGTDGETYILVGGNEYANAKQMDLQDETSKQSLSGILHVGSGNGEYIRLYTNPLNGSKVVRNRALAKNTDWITDQKVTVDGNTYYRVATNEWVKESDANLTSENSRSEKTYIKNAPDAEESGNTDINNNNGSTTTNNNSGSTGTDTGNTGSGTTETKTATVTVNYVDMNGNKISSSKIETEKVGSDYVMISKNIDGYDLVNQAEQKITVSSDSSKNVINFKYQVTKIHSNMETVTVKFINEAGETIAPDRQEDAEINSVYTSKALSIYDYTVKDSDTQNLTVSKDGSNVITFVYSKNSTTTPTDPSTDKFANVTVKYVDENNKEISTAKTIPNQKVGTQINESAIDIPGYDLTSAISQNQTVAESGNTIIFQYKAKDTTPTDPEENVADVTVKYLDDNGVEVHTSKTLAGKAVGDTVSETAPVISGYTIKGDSTKNLTISKSGNVITFTYTKDKVIPITANVTVNYLDENGKTLQASKTEKAEIGKSYKADAPTISGYTINGDKSQTVNIDGDKIITFTYTANPVQQGKYQFKVSYIGLNGNLAGGESDDDYYEILPSKSGSTDERFNNLSSYMLDIPGYELDSRFNSKGDLDNYVASDDASSNNIEIYYVSTKQPITVHYVDEDGKTLAPDATDSWYTDTDRQVPYSKITGYYVKDVKKETHLTVKPGQNEITVHYTKNPVISTDEIASKLLDLVNNYRKESNLTNMLTTNDLLTAGAKVRADDEATQIAKAGNIDDYDHIRNDGKDWNTESHLNEYSKSQYGMGENIAVGNGFETADEIAKSAFNKWMRDDPHRLQMIEPKAFETGIGVKQVGEYDYLIVQDFGNDYPNSVWDASDYNTASPADLGYTLLEVTNSARYFNDDLFNGTTTKNSYISDHIFKSEDDFNQWFNDYNAGGTKVNQSIWTKGGSDAKISCIGVQDYHTGNFIGWVPVITNMDKSAQDYLDAGATTWF